MLGTTLSRGGTVLRQKLCSATGKSKATLTQQFEQEQILTAFLENYV